MHTILWLHSSDKIHTVSDIDRIISAELPNPDHEPALYETVSRTMIHRCGPRCKPQFPEEPENRLEKCRYGYDFAFGAVPQGDVD